MGEVTKPELGLRERRKRATRQALSRAALTLTAEHGIDHVTVEAISEAAGVSERTFFNYFATKEDALTGDTEDIARLREYVRTAPAELSALSALEYALCSELDEILQHPEVFTLRMQVLERNPSLFPKLMASSESAMRDLTLSIAERVNVPADHAFPGLLAFVSAATFHSTMLKWHSSGREGDPHARVTEAFALLRNGFPDPL